MPLPLIPAVDHKVGLRGDESMRLWKSHTALDMQYLAWLCSTWAYQSLYATMLSSLEVDNDVPTCPRLRQYCRRSQCDGLEVSWLWLAGLPAYQRHPTFRRGRLQRHVLDPWQLPTKQAANRLHMPGGRACRSLAVSPSSFPSPGCLPRTPTRPPSCTRRIQAEVFTTSNSAIDDIAALIILPILISVKTQRGFTLVGQGSHKTAKVGEALASSSQLLACCSKYRFARHWTDDVEG